MFNSVSGSSASGTNKSSMSNGIGGLVSGLDTDTLVENMTMGTSNKIDTQKQQKQLLQWKKEAYRTITQGLTEFNDSYFSYTSSTNITSPSFFESYKVNNLSSKVGLSGKLQNAKYVQIDEISQLATKTKYTYRAKEDTILSGTVNTADWTTSSLDGQSLTVKVGDKSYSLSFDRELGNKIKKAAGSDEAAQRTKLSQAINQMLIDAGAVDKDGKALVTTSIDSSGALSFKGSTSSKVTLSGTTTVMSALGFGSVKEAGGSGNTVTAANALSNITKEKTLAEQLSGQTIKFYLDGKIHSVTLDNYSGTDTNDIMNKVVDKINTELKNAFGTRTNSAGNEAAAVQAKYVSGELQFDLVDATSTFALDSATGNVLGEHGVFGIKAGTSTKLNSSTKLEDMGLESSGGKTLSNINADGYGKVSFAADATKHYQLTLSDGSVVGFDGTLEDAQEKLKDKGISVAKGGTFGDQLVFTAKNINEAYIKGVSGDNLNQADVKKEDALYEIKIKQNDDGTGGSSILIRASDTLSKIMDKIGQSDLDANMTYSAITGTFVLESKNYGTSERLNITGGGLAEVLFGVKAGEDVGTNDAVTDTSGNARATYHAGTNAKVKMTINGEQKDIERTSNVITVDGLNIELKQEHKLVQKVNANGTPMVDQAGNPVMEPDPITFDVENDADKVVENMKAFIEAYNGIVKTISTAIKTRQDPKERYDPLTDSQKENMTEKQIEKWEAEAKKSVLFNDSTLSGILQSLRSALYGSVEGVGAALSSIGITTGEWSKNGQLELDETKFRKALSEDPAKVSALFTQQSEVDYSPDLKGEQRKQRYNESGFMYRFQDILKSAVGTTTPKGTLLQIAGMENDRTDSDNQISKKIKDIDERIEKLEKQLKTERERYWKKFTSLETYINKLNAQSANLLQQFQ